MSKYIKQLPPKVQTEIAHDVIRILEENTCCSTNEIVKIVHYEVMNSKLIDIIGSEEDGLLDYDKYSKYL